MHSGCTSTVKVAKWDGTFEIRFLFVKFACSRYVPEMQEQPSHYISCFFNFCNNCVFVEVSNNQGWGATAKKHRLRLQLRSYQAFIH